jgi:DNA-binding MarR family transcriptional regulator
VTFQSLIRTFGLLGRLMQPHFARFGVSASQWGVLRTLYRTEQAEPSGLRLTDLSERLLVRPPSVTGVVGRLERMGLVVRDSSPLDLRAKHVRLTPKGRRLIEDAALVHRQQVERILSGLTADEQTELHRSLGKLGQHLQGMLDAGGSPPNDSPVNGAPAGEPSEPV